MRAGELSTGDRNATSAAAGSAPLMILVAVPTILLTVAGCGSERPESFTRVPLEGTVTLDGAPLDDAIIRFVPTGQTPGPKTVYPVRDGKFVATRRNGPPVGTHRVEIALADEGEFAHDDEQALRELSQTPRRRIEPPRLPQFDRAGSPLTAELSEPAGDRPQVLEFSLTSRTR